MRVGSIRSTFEEGISWRQGSYRTHGETEYIGHPGLLHGGGTCVLYDEVMFHAIARNDIVAVIAKITVYYRSPALVDDLLVC